MSNYYEMLGLATDANTADIHRAVDNRYNEMRQLATHPDATVVEEANRNLRLLEQMRATLTDTNLPVYMIAVEKREPLRCCVWRYSEEVLGQAQKENEEGIERLKKCRERDEWLTGYEGIRDLDWI